MEQSKAWKQGRNPISPDIFCADPTAVVYEGRLYVYGTNDHQQYEEGTTGSNTYEAIKSFVIFSTDDMVNWVYHGMIDTAAIAPWVYASWAPSITSRVEADGKTHFYLYFSNSGDGVGVLTATHPLGPWHDPLGKPLISAGMAGLEGVPNPFDPGVDIDQHGTGWLTFGGGMHPACGSEAMPHTARIVRLGDDMISLASEFAEIPAPYFFEASELNIIGDTYVYTYNTNWVERKEWSYPADAPTRCSMCCMTSKTPLVPDSWQFQRYYFPNPGDCGYPDSNNHTHLQAYRGKWYLLYHTLQREAGLGMTGGYRSLCVTELAVEEDAARYGYATATDEGAAPLQHLNPYVEQQGATAWSTNGIGYLLDDALCVQGVTGMAEDAWVCVRDVDFGEGAKGFAAALQGQGMLQIALDTPDGAAVCILRANAPAPLLMEMSIEDAITGVHDVYLRCSAGMTLYQWQFKK